MKNFRIKTFFATSFHEGVEILIPAGLLAYGGGRLFLH
jgi:hypothetical protein